MNDLLPIFSEALLIGLGAEVLNNIALMFMGTDFIFWFRCMIYALAAVSIITTIYYKVQKGKLENENIKLKNEAEENSRKGFSYIADYSKKQKKNESK